MKREFVGIRIVMIGENILAPYIEYRDEDGWVGICELGSKGADEILFPGHYGLDMLIRVSRALELERSKGEQIDEVFTQVQP